MPVALLCLSTVGDVRSAEPNESITEVIKRVSQAVVFIETDVGSGSGFVVDVDKRLIATNYHVVEGAKEATVKFGDGTSVACTGFVSISAEHDLALIRIPQNKSLTISLSLSTVAPEPGEQVFAIGSPKGLTGTVADGIASGIRSGADIRETFLKELGIDVYGALGYSVLTKWVQSSAPISPGNSGGPLLNSKGDVIGVNTWSRGGGQNLNFAVAAEHLRTLMLNLGPEQTLSLLPKPRANISVFAPSNGTKTLAFWKAYGQLIKESNLKQLRMRPITIAPKHVMTYWYNRSRELAAQAAATKKLDPSGIDVELSLLAAIDSDNMLKLSLIYSSAADALKTSQNPPIPDTVLVAALNPSYYATLQSDMFTQQAFMTLAAHEQEVAAKNTIINQMFTLLRATYTARYNIAFPDIWSTNAAGDKTK